MTLTQEPWKFSSPNKETSEKGVSISERWLWIYEKRHTWVCKGKILKWSLGYSFSTGELWFVNSFIQDSADKHIPLKTSRSVSSIPWITPEIKRKIRRKNKTHAKAKKTSSSKLKSNFETLRRETKVFHPWKGRMERVLLSRISKRQRNTMVSLRMCSLKMNEPRSRFWIGLHLSLLFLRTE